MTLQLSTHLASPQAHICVCFCLQLDESVERERRIERARQAWTLFVSGHFAFLEL